MKGLRANLRRRRAALPAAIVMAHSEAISRRLWGLPPMARARRIACYLAVAGEVDCGPFMQEAAARGREIYLPVLRGQGLVFARWHAAASLALNQFGIPEPEATPGECLRGAQLDVVLAPLVAFDLSGRRLGMGGGYYDRSFAFTRQRAGWRRPRLVGVAHEFQCVGSLPAQPWDIAMHAVVTESGVRVF